MRPESHGEQRQRHAGRLPVDAGHDVLYTHPGRVGRSTVGHVDDDDAQSDSKGRQRPHAVVDLHGQDQELFDRLDVEMPRRDHSAGPDCAVAVGAVAQTAMAMVRERTVMALIAKLLEHLLCSFVHVLRLLLRVARHRLLRSAAPDRLLRPRVEQVDHQRPFLVAGD